MTIENSTTVIDGITFDLIGAGRTRSRPDRFGMRKTEWMANRYRELARDCVEGNVVELGVDQGASTAFLALLLSPKRLVAIDLAPGPQPALDELLASRGIADSVTVHWNVDQSDRATIETLLDDAFGDEPLDLVVDDASHLLGPTRASFDILFPRLAPGGRYVIEDWSATEKMSAAMAAALAGTDRAASDRVSTALADAMSRGPTDTPMSHLILELVLAAATAPDLVSDVALRSGWCEVTKGSSVIGPEFRLADHLGGTAAMLLAETD